MTRISKSEPSRICAEIDERVKAFLDRPLEGGPTSGWMQPTTRCAAESLSPDAHEGLKVAAAKMLGVLAAMPRPLHEECAGVCRQAQPPDGRRRVAQRCEDQPIDVARIAAS